MRNGIGKWKEVSKGIRGWMMLMHLSINFVEEKGTWKIKREDATHQTWMTLSVGGTTNIILFYFLFIFFLMCVFAFLRLFCLCLTFSFSWVRSACVTVSKSKGSEDTLGVFMFWVWKCGLPSLDPTTDKYQHEALTQSLSRDS